MKLTKAKGAAKGGIGNHIETLSTAELVIFSKVCYERDPMLDVAKLNGTNTDHIL